MSPLPPQTRLHLANVLMARVGRWGHAHAPLLLILAAFGLLAAAYGATVPLGETPDELAHYRYVRYIDATGHPPRTREEREASGYKGHEPPLYYLLLHRATGWLRVSQRPMLKLIDPDLEPQHSIGAEVLLWNAVLHTADESFPWRGTSLAWHLMRLVSVPLGMVTILGVYRVGRILAPDRPALATLAAGLTAFTPQFVYLSSAVNNDNLAIPLSVLTLAALVAMSRGDLRWRRFLAVGLLAGLARLSKFHTLVLLPVIVLALALIAWRRRAWRRCALGGALALGLTVLVSAPWILAVQPDEFTSGSAGVIWALLGLSDPMHARDLAAGAGGAGGPTAVAGLLLGALRLEPLRWARILFQSYWAFFGQMTVAVSPGIYLGLAALVVVGVAGALRLLLARRAIPTGALILALQALAFLGVALVFYALMQRLPDPAQGRHLYPALPAWSLLLAAGLLAWVPERHARRVTAGLLVAMAALSAYLLPAYALAAYEPPLPVRTTLPAAWRPEVVSPGDGTEAAPGIAYLGCSPAAITARAGETLDLALLWRAAAPIKDERLVRVEYAAADGTWRQLHLAHPVDGRWPTRAWDPGDYVRDRHAILVPPGLPAGEYALRAAWADLQGQPIGAPAFGCRLRVEGSGRSPAGLLVNPVPSASEALRYRQGMVLAAPGTALEATAAVASSDGAIWRPIATERHPVDGGEIWQAYYVVGPDTRPGTYALTAGDGEPFTVRVETRDRRFDVPEEMVPSRWHFGEHPDGGISLAGWRLEAGGVGPAEAGNGAVARPGETIGLTLAWRAEGWIARNYTVFTHLVGDDDIPLAQHDGIPQGGHATLFWAPAEVVVDYHPLVLPADIPPGDYRILVGLYTRPDGARLPVVDFEEGAIPGATAAMVAIVQVVSEGER